MREGVYLIRTHHTVRVVGAASLGLTELVLDAVVAVVASKSLSPCHHHTPPHAPTPPPLLLTHHHTHTHHALSREGRKEGRRIIN